MSDIITLANQVAAAKEDIRQAIEIRGVNIPATTPLNEYAAKIAAIDTENSASDLYQRDPDFDTTATTFTVPGNIGTIADNGLAEYTNLEEINFQYTQTLAPYACADDTNLTTITADHLKYIGEDAFRNTGFVDFTNPHVQYVGASSFSNCANLQSVTMSGLTHIPAGAFFNNPVLETITFENVKNVGTEAFNSAVMLTNINLPKAETIATYAFSNVGNSAYTTYGTTIQLALPKVKNILPYAFYGSNGISSIDLPEVETIGNYAFSSTSGTNINISIPSVKSIGTYNFLKNANEDIYLPNCEYIGNGCFTSTNKKIKTLTVSNDGCVIGDAAFYGSTSSYIVPEKIIGKVTRVGPGAIGWSGNINTNLTFDMDWSSLEYIGSLNAIGESAFHFQGSNSGNILTIPGGALDFKNLRQCGYLSGSNRYPGFGGNYWSAITNNHNVRKIWIPDSCTYFVVVNLSGKSASDPIHIYTDKAAGISNWYFTNAASTNSKFTTGDSDPYIIIHWGCTHQDFENGIYN